MKFFLAFACTLSFMGCHGQTVEDILIQATYKNAGGRQALARVVWNEKGHEAGYRSHIEYVVYGERMMGRDVFVVLPNVDTRYVSKILFDFKPEWICDHTRNGRFRPDVQIKIVVGEKTYRKSDLKPFFTTDSGNVTSCAAMLVLPE